MCARFNLATPELAGKYFQGRLIFDEQPMYNIAPSEIVLAAVADSDGLGSPRAVSSRPAASIVSVLATARRGPWANAAATAWVRVSGWAC